jgi:APA family basic amino acid/polyamine antiporter
MVELKRRLNRTDALAITLGAVIGVGVFRNTGLVMRGAGGFVGATVLWLVIPLLCLCGASLYADLSGRVPEAGGQYAYVRTAFGGRPAFLYGWMYAGVALPARQAATVAVAGEVMARWIPVSPRALAIALLLVLAVVHLGGVRAGAIAQRIFTAGKLATIAIVVGLSISLGWRGASVDVAFEPATFAAAVGAVWYTYLGWQDVVVLAEEVHNPRRDLPFVLFGTVLLTTVLYVAIHFSVYLGLAGSAEAYGTLPALDLAKHALGDRGETLLRALMLSSMIGVSAIGVFLRPRISMALARDGLGPKPLTRVSSFGTPYVALGFHTLIALVLVSTGSYVKLLELISFATGVMGLFEIASYFVVRHKRPELPTSRLHPWGPLVFLLMAGTLVVLGAKANPMGVVTSFAIVAGIGILYALTRPKLLAPQLP